MIFIWKIDHNGLKIWIVKEVMIRFKMMNKLLNKMDNLLELKRKL